MRPSRSGFPRNPRKYQGGWINLAIAAGTALLGKKSSDKASSRASAAANRELDLQERELDLADKQEQRASELYDYYQETFQPVEKRLVGEAMEGISPARAEARAIKDTRTASANARGISERNLRRQGVNPNSGRFVSSDRAVQLGEAALEAGARTNARESTRDRNFGRKLDVVQLGRNLPATAGNMSSMAQQGVAGVAGAAGVNRRRAENLAFDAGSDFGASMADFADELYSVFENRGSRGNTTRPDPQRGSGEGVYF